ncbi:MAG: hypothetical protein ACRD0P_39315, partial [Stackebrandtia sp.]
MSTPSTAPTDLIRRWYNGWTQCRNLRRGKETAHGLQASPRLPGRHHDLVTGDDSTTIATLAAAVTGADKPTWLIIATTDPATVRDILDTAGLALAVPAQTLLTCTLRQHP